MNFQTILEELDRLYEADQQIKAQEKTADQPEVQPEVKPEAEEAKTESCNKALKEAAEDEEILVDDEPIVDDEEATTVEDEAIEDSKQVVLECSNCGALLVKNEADIETSEDSELVNVDEGCQFCEEAKGYKIIGAMVPYEAVEVEEIEEVEETEETDVAESDVVESLTEGKLIDTVKKVATRVGADAATLARCFAELGDDIANIGKDGDDYKSTKLYDLMTYVENKAVLKALLNGNETVLNTCTKEDIEDLQQEIEEYKKAKAGKSEDEELEELFDANVSLGVDGGTGNNVSVLSTSLNEKVSEEELEELFDANIGLSLDGGENNDVDVL